MVSFLVSLFVRPAPQRPVIVAPPFERPQHRPRPVVRLLNRLAAFDAFDAVGC